MKPLYITPVDLVERKINGHLSPLSVQLYAGQGGRLAAWPVLRDSADIPAKLWANNPMQAYKRFLNHLLTINN